MSQKGGFKPLRRSRCNGTNDQKRTLMDRARGFFERAMALDPGNVDALQAETHVGLALDPTFTIQRFRSGRESDNPIFLTGKERIIEGMRKSGVPEG